MSGELITVNESGNSIVELLNAEVKKNGLTQTKEFYDFYLQVQKNEAEKAFGNAFEELMSRVAGIQFVKDGAIPKWKTGENLSDAEKTRRSIPFMTYEQVWRKTGPHFRALGLTIRFTSRIQEGKPGVTWTLHVRHRAGHEETSDKWMPPLDSSQMNNLQQYGGADSYTQRYLLTKYLNIIALGEDDDGESFGAEARISSEQVLQALERIEYLNMTEDGVCQALSIKSLETMPLSKWEVFIQRCAGRERGLREKGILK